MGNYNSFIIISLGCQTKSGKRCIFPFKDFGTEIYHHCIYNDYQANFLCPTMIDEDDMNGYEWEECSDDCPKGKYNIREKQDFFLIFFSVAASTITTTTTTTTTTTATTTTATTTTTTATTTTQTPQVSCLGKCNFKNKECMIENNVPTCKCLEVKFFSRFSTFYH